MNIITNSLFLSQNQIDIIEKKYDAKYVFESTVKSSSGTWMNYPVAIFYTKKKHAVSKNRWMGVYINPFDNKFYVCNAISATEPFVGVVADNGDVIYSHYRHHYNISNDGSVFIDGGRDYIKGPTGKRYVNIHVKGGKLHIVEDIKNEI